MRVRAHSALPQARQGIEVHPRISNLQRSFRLNVGFECEEQKLHFTKSLCLNAFVLYYKGSMTTLSFRGENGDAT